LTDRYWDTESTYVANYYHKKPSKTSYVKTMCIASDENGQFSFIVAEGESQKGAIPKQGNTLTRGYFGDDISQFVEDWSEAGNNHHYSLSVGHNASAIKKLAKALDIGYVQVR